MKSMNQKRFTNIAVVILVIAVAVAAVAGYFVLAERSAAPVSVEEVGEETTVPVVDEATLPAAPADGTADWNTYRNKEHGFEFEYPPEYPDPVSGWWRWNMDIHFLSEQGTAINIGREISADSCMDLLCNKPVQEKLFVNNISWDYLGETGYCDAGECFSGQSIYRTIRGNYRYYIIFEVESRERDVLSTFKFLE